MFSLFLEKIHLTQYAQKKPDNPGKPITDLSDPSISAPSGAIGPPARPPTAGSGGRQRVGRSQALTLPSDRREAVAQALAFIRGAQTFDRGAAFEELTRRVESYVDPASNAAITELAEHLPVLEALWLRFAAEATTAASPDNRSKLLRMALQAHGAYCRALVLVQGLGLQQRRQGQVVIEGCEIEE